MVPTPLPIPVQGTTTTAISAVATVSYPPVAIDGLPQTMHHPRMVAAATAPLAPTTRITTGNSNVSNAANSTVRFEVATDDSVGPTCGRWMLLSAHRDKYQFLAPTTGALRFMTTWGCPRLRRDGRCRSHHRRRWCRRCAFAV